MIHNQSSVPSCKIPRSIFDLSAPYITTFEPDYLVPFAFYDVVPGDTFNFNADFLLRFNNLTHPFMDNMYVDTFYFFVPYRLVWDNWVKLYGQQDNPGDSVDYIAPKVTIKGMAAPTTTLQAPGTVNERWVVNDASKIEVTGDDVADYSYEGSLFNYLGIPISAHYEYSKARGADPYYLRAREAKVNNYDFRPTPTSWDVSAGAKERYYDQYGSLPVKMLTEDKTINSLRFRAYNLIWNEWFRDENLQDSVEVPKGDGPDDPAIFRVLKRGKRHDYFTSCLPWPQKGPAVLLPLGQQAPVVGTGMTLGLTDGSHLGGMAQSSSSGAFTGFGNTYGANAGTNYSGSHNISNGKSVGVVSDPDKSGLVADLSMATSATVNQLREAFAVQRLYEKRARGGTRYFESLESLFGVTNPDLRLQRPEYLGGSSKPFQITQVPQTSSATENSPQGNLSAYSATFGRSGFTHSFGEWGVVIGLMSVRADLTYQQGISRHYFKQSFLDYYTPTLAFLGEQAVLNEEIYAQGDNVVDENGEKVDKKVFGYMPRWDEYRYDQALVTGYMSSLSPESLDNWHLAQEFDDLPQLNDEFIQEQVPIARIKQVVHQPSFMIHIAKNCRAARPFPTYSEPGLIDHF